jgi:prevent-host-death family protein
MKRMSIQALKSQLSAAVAEAESGGIVEITRHNRPVAVLVSAESQHVHRGPRVGTGRITSAVKRGSKGRYMTLLHEDRSSR